MCVILIQMKEVVNFFLWRSIDDRSSAGDNLTILHEFGIVEVYISNTSVVYMCVVKEIYVETGLFEMSIHQPV